MHDPADEKSDKQGPVKVPRDAESIYTSAYSVMPDCSYEANNRPK